MGEHSDKIKGKAKQVAGDITDNEELHAEGEADEAAGNAKKTVDKIADSIHSAIDRVRSRRS